MKSIRPYTYQIQMCEDQMFIPKLLKYYLKCGHTLQNFQFCFFNKHIKILSNFTRNQYH